ncbi:MAG: DNA-processing protein DprA [Ruminococcaceae bacterium]|nr:DNA-processing protein DprA [Oscillospiraceae bacterium]
MTGAELGFLLLGSHLGDPTRRPLTPSQLVRLRQRVQAQGRTMTDGQVDGAFLRSLGYSANDSAHILSLLGQLDLAIAYLERAEKLGFHCITRCSENYPNALAEAERYSPPVVLWGRGEISLLHTPCISLVGSRQARTANLNFAQAVGTEAALQGYTLVSGGAKGIDSAGQFACRNVGGKVICVVPDALTEHLVYGPGVLFLSEDSYDLHFTHQRALSRNSVIHILGSAVFVAQCDTQGGTWSGTTNNLKHGWRPVYCYRDDSPAAKALVSMGATPVGEESLKEIADLLTGQNSLFSQQ